jgi:TRAP-type C4-dicarboxylate transport system permease small subunit
MFPALLYGLRRIERISARVLLALITALVILASGARYAGHPIIWAIEVTQALFVWLCVMAGDLTLQRLGHFSIDVAVKLLPARLRHALALANLLLVACLLAVLIWYGFAFARFTGMRPLPMTGVSSAAATAAMPVGFALMLLTLAEHFIRLLRQGPGKGTGSGAREVM